MIRRGFPDDARGIATVHVLSWQGAYRGLLPDALLDSLDTDARTEGWRRRLDAANEATTIVAERDGRIVGFAHVVPARDEGEDPSSVGELASIYVLPDVWGTGVGRDLMRGAVDALRESGYTRAALWVLQGNERAIRFYEAAGWTADGTSKVDVIGATPVTELRYRRRLD